MTLVLLGFGWVGESARRNQGSKKSTSRITSARALI